MLKLSGVIKRFGQTLALNGVNLELQKGEVHALIGENGAGKSTLMNILSGSLQPDAGTMELGGQPYRPSDPQEARRRGLAHIHQELSLCPHLSVAENILMGMEPAQWGWLDRDSLRRQALEILENFSHPEITPNKLVADLSIAARQIVEICRALAQKAGIILMDEPTSSLQRDDVERLFRCIQNLRNSGISIIYISHFLEEVREIADTFTVLRDGQSIASGTLQSVSDDQLISLMVGRSVNDLFPLRKAFAAPEVVLQVQGLRALPGVKQASLELRSGEILGIAGLIGSGRTEMLRAVFGLAPVETGTVVIRKNSVPARHGATQSRIRQGVGYLSEDRKGEGLALALPIADNVTFTRFSSCSSWGWLNRKTQAQQSEQWIAQLGIRARGPWSAVQKLSGGNQQKVAIARLLHQDADIFLLDEPTRGVDIGSKAQIYEVITRLAAAGKAVLVVSSYLPELFGLCDRLAVMSRGRISASRPIGEWTPETVLQASIAGEDSPVPDATRNSSAATAR